MHQLDAKKLDVILFQQLPEEGLGITINDKLRRASK
jgi:L-threonylcarbamoyladenylate synthase